MRFLTTIFITFVLYSFSLISLPTLAQQASYGQTSHGQSFIDVEQALETLTNPEQRLALLTSSETLIAGFTLEQQSKYWFLLGRAREKNKMLDLAISAYTRSIDNEKSYHKGPTVQQVESLIERAYVRYLQTYDTRLYCPDRKQALEQARLLNNSKLLVKVLVRYSFCFKDNGGDLSEGLALLDEAIVIATDNKLSARDHAMIYNSSGLLYRNNHVYDKGYDFLKKAYQQWASVNDYQDMFNMQHTLNVNAIQMKRFDLAEQHVDTMFYLTKSQTQFVDFAFFSHFNAGLLAYFQGKFKESAAQYELALIEQDNTGEKYFVYLVYENLIVSYFRLGKYKQVKSLLMAYGKKFPLHQIENLQILAIADFMDENYSKAMQGFYLSLDEEIDKTREFVKRSTLTTTSLFSVNITELDNKILQQELEINTLRFDKEQAKKRNAYLSLILVSAVAFSLILLSWYLLRTRKVFKFRAQTDYLTRIANRRHSFEGGQQLLTQASLYNQPLSLLIFDIDHFKKVNDTLGHDIGDQAIQLVVEKSKQCLRKQDFLGRIGGEEFLLLLPDTELEKAAEIAERIRLAVASASVGEASAKISLSISLGVVCLQEEQQLKALINRADKALYQAKHAGRNRVICG